MSSFTARYAEPAPYRRACIMLLLVSVTLPIVLDLSDVPDWLRLLPFFLLCLPAYILLCVLTYNRLRNAWLAGGWIALMIIITHFGPGWHVSTHVDFRLGDMISLIPIILAWFAPARWGSNPPPSDTKRAPRHRRRALIR